LAKFAPRSLLTYQGTHPLVLDLYLVQNFGPEYYEWEPETLWTEAMRVSQAPNVSEVNRNKIQAVRTVHLTDTTFQRWEVFEKIIAALNGIVPRFNVMQQPDLGQLMFGVDVMSQLRGGKFSEEIARYTASCLLTDGICYAPKPIHFCNPLLAIAHPLHAATKKAFKGKAENDAVEVQVKKIQEGSLYKTAGSARLLEQMRVLRGT